MIDAITVPAGGLAAAQVSLAEQVEAMASARREKALGVVRAALFASAKGEPADPAAVLAALDTCGIPVTRFDAAVKVERRRIGLAADAAKLPAAIEVEQATGQAERQARVDRDDAVRRAEATYQAVLSESYRAAGVVSMLRQSERELVRLPCPVDVLCGVAAVPE